MYIKFSTQHSVNVVVNDTDKNIDSVCAVKTDVITEYRRQLYNKEVYKQLTQGEAEQLIRVIKKHLSNIVSKHTMRKTCSKKEANFLLLNLNKFKIPNFISSGNF